ncbi:MAG: hypothetical protein A2913_01740 [Parcubacteria group bacterium RIFCSPLOWO2_01_FULL_40_65]|nr:MAG: hypothetical protein A3D40_01495 [Parcubacteria group bacterium RIFCSPHIGHO2_02_FULL_40_12]OHB21558.1 MAG: hypothetical protein A2913_01740 [Parcubacteria group bacterium RIFCSPLOWO2_01_FULL_40_65]
MATLTDNPPALSDKKAARLQHNHSTTPTFLCPKYATEFMDTSHAQPNVMTKSRTEKNEKMNICPPPLLKIQLFINYINYIINFWILSLKISLSNFFTLSFIFFESNSL